MSDAPSKTRATYYTTERVAAARANADDYAWAAELREEAVEDADGVLERGLEGLWRWPTGQAIPRTWGPLNGTQHGDWETMDDRPWKITDGEWILPTNDFAAYRESGRDDRGFFDPDLADDRHLVNEEHPELGEGWGVDDGYGFADEPGHIYEAGDRWLPVAYYNHYAVWYGVRDALSALRDAYVFTGEQRYATAGTVLLDRVADVYPGLDISEHDDVDGVHNSHGGTGAGKMVGSIWETNLVREMVSAYDAFFPAQAGDDDLVAFLSGEAEDYPGLGGKGSVTEIRSNVETNLVREVLPGVEAAQIRGNFGHHQSALAMAAVVADDPERYTADALGFLFRPGELVNETGQTWKEYEEAHGGPPGESEPDWRVTGGDVATALVDRVDRDGHGDESAPNYNRIVQSQSQRIARILSVYDADLPDVPFVEPDLFAHPKVEKTYHGQYPLVALDRYTPGIGDSAKTGNPEVYARADAAAEGFERYDDPRLARVAHALNGYESDGLHGDVFERRDDPLADEIDEVIAADGPLDLGSTLLPSYGFAALRDGDRSGGDGGDPRRTAWLYFGRNSTETGTSHAHQDALNLGVYAHGLDLAPDLGYPERTGGWPKRWNWTANTVSHNTALVDDERQRPQVVSNPRRFADGERVQVADVEAPDAYPQTDEYRRTVAQVRVDDERSYLADFFRVAGGEEHLFSFHGAEGDVHTDGLDLDPQDGGTYAGSDVPRPDHGEDTAYNEAVGNGFNYLDEVERDGSPGDSFTVDWAVEDTWDVRAEADSDVHLRLTMCTACDEVALANGEPPQNKDGNPESLRYLLARRSGREASAFASVVDPYEDAPAVESVERIPVEVADGEAEAESARALRVDLATGRTDYVLSATDPDATYAVGDAVRIRGAFGVYAERDGEPAYAYVHAGTLVQPVGGDPLIERDRGRVGGTLLGFTRDLARENELVVSTEGRAADAAAAIGENERYVHVDSHGPGNGTFRVEDAAADGDALRLSVGNQTPIRGFVDSENPGAGFEYDVAEGASLSVPLDAEWEA